MAERRPKGAEAWDNAHELIVLGDSLSSQLHTLLLETVTAGHQKLPRVKFVACLLIECPKLVPADTEPKNQQMRLRDRVRSRLDAILALGRERTAANKHWYLQEDPQKS